MRIIKEKTLYEKCQKDSRYQQALESVKSWIFEIRLANWDSPTGLKLKYRNASIINSKRVVFNIKGNEFRLITDIEYKLRIVFIVWFGTHKEYDKIDVKTISYED